MIGSHNTFTYMRPLKWWMNVLTPIAKCQNRNVDKYDADIYDIRIRCYCDVFYVSHGPVLYCSLYDAIHILRQKYKTTNKTIYIRLLLEGEFSQKQLDCLTGIINIWGTMNFTFVCGRDKQTWKKLLPNLSDLDVEQMVGSMQSNYGKVCPWLWWKLNQRKIKKMQSELDSNNNYLFDFI